MHIEVPVLAPVPMTEDDDLRRALDYWSKQLEHRDVDPDEPWRDADVMVVVEQLVHAALAARSEPRPTREDIEAMHDYDDIARQERSEPPAEGLDALLDIRHEEDDSWSVSVRAMPGHVGVGDSLPEAFRDAHEAALLWIDTLRALAPERPE